ncbi:MAG: twin-arginine translocase subunit TatC [Pseudomonadota bacterium]|nr:twin-arginine translocase subunit TatC [Pseudomonadota bacterium]
MTSSQTENPEKQDCEMHLTDHLEELRKRLIFTFIVIAAATVGSYYFAEDLFRLLMAPLLDVMPADSGLIFTSLTETFFTYLKISLLAGFFVASPVVIYQIWRFSAPGLYAKEKRYVFPFVFFATIFFVGGAMFGYFIVFPFGFKFFMGFASDFITPMPTVKEYFSFAVRLLFAFGVVFELPVVTAFLAMLGLVSAKTLANKRKFAVLGSFVVAAVLTPPDVVSQLMMAGPIIILYEMSIIVARICGREKTTDIEED